MAIFNIAKIAPFKYEGFSNIRNTTVRSGAFGNFKEFLFHSIWGSLCLRGNPWQTQQK